MSVIFVFCWSSFLLAITPHAYVGHNHRHHHQQRHPSNKLPLPNEVTVLVPFCHWGFIFKTTTATTTSTATKWHRNFFFGVTFHQKTKKKNKTHCVTPKSEKVSLVAVAKFFPSCLFILISNFWLANQKRNNLVTEPACLSAVQKFLKL